MSTLSTTPLNRSFLSNNKFEFILNRIPNFTFLVQSVNLPSIALAFSEINTPATAIRIPGNIISFSQMTLSFMIDEDMQSWYEIYNWIFQLGNPQSNVKLGNLTQIPGRINSTTSDATLFIKTNSNNPNWKVEFKDLFPVDLSELNFSTTDSQEFLTATATFNYTYYTLTNI